MKPKGLTHTLLASAAAVGASALMGGHALAFVAASPFTIYETVGVYNVVNNSSDLYIYDFEVSNPLASPGLDATTRSGWVATTCGSCNGNYTNASFEYYDGSSTPALSELIGPGQSSAQFTFSAPLASDYTVFAHTITGSSVTFTGTTIVSAPVSAAPEPSIWAMMIAGVGVIGAFARRRQTASSAVKAAA